MTTTDGRHERHMMRQRGAGARSIPTNFGFVFQAGPIQLSASTPTESPVPSNASHPIIEHSEALQPPELPCLAEKAVPKRKRLVIREDEEEDQVWFSKRSKKTNTPQQDQSPMASTVSEEATLDRLQTQPPTATKPAKRKTVRKRILVPRSRQKAPGEPVPQPRPDRPSVSADPAAEDAISTKKETRVKAAAVLKEKPRHLDTPAAPLPDHDQINDWTNNSSQHISTKKPAPSNKPPSDQDDLQETRNSKKRPKAVVRKRLVRKHIQEDAANEQPSLQEDAKTMKPSLPPSEQSLDENSNTKVIKKRKVAGKHVENPTEEQMILENQADAANLTEVQPPKLAEEEKHTDQPVQAEKKRKVVKRVRVPKVTKTEVGPEKPDRTADATTQDGLKDTRQRRRLPLEEGAFNMIPKKPETSLNAENLPNKNNTREQKAKQSKIKKTEKTRETVSEKTFSLPTEPKSTHHSESVVAGAKDADLALFETEASILVTKKATKPPKRVFNDDSEIDLDQMLSGIAAMAGTEAAKSSVTKSARVVKRKAAVSKS